MELVAQEQAAEYDVHSPCAKCLTKLLVFFCLTSSPIICNFSHVWEHCYSHPHTIKSMESYSSNITDVYEVSVRDNHATTRALLCNAVPDCTVNMICHAMMWSFGFFPFPSPSCHVAHPFLRQMTYLPLWDPHFFLWNIDSYGCDVVFNRSRSYSKDGNLWLSCYLLSSCWCSLSKNIHKRVGYL